MAADEYDVWGDLSELLDPNAENPVEELLEQQAALLRSKSHGLLTGRVVRESKGVQQLWRLIAVPRGYDEGTTLLCVSHAEGIPFPARVEREYMHSGDGPAANRSELVARLRRVLQTADARWALSEAARAALRASSRATPPSDHGPSRLDWLSVSNFRAARAVELPLTDRAVLFGPNGAGKSTVLDALSLLGDFARRGLRAALRVRGRGVDMFCDRGEIDALKVGVGDGAAAYHLALERDGERIARLPRESFGFDRSAYSRGADAMIFVDGDEVTLTRPDECSLPSAAEHLRGPASRAALALHRALLGLRVYHAGRFDLDHLRRRGSDAEVTTQLDERGHNLWAVLRTLTDTDPDGPRLLAIERHLRRAFPDVEGFRTMQGGPEVVVGRILERHRRKPVSASGAPDGLLHFLLLLTAMFAPEAADAPLVVFDEPEIALHPWALAVLAEAMSDAVTQGKRVLLATHSPVLLSQFTPEECVVVEQIDGETRLTRLSEMDDVADLLRDYATGALYMAQLIAPQKRPDDAPRPGDPDGIGPEGEVPGEA